MTNRRRCNSEYMNIDEAKEVCKEKGVLRDIAKSIEARTNKTRTAYPEIEQHEGCSGF